MAKSRSNGDGTFRDLKNGTVEYTISYGNDVYGKRLRKRFYGANKTECHRAARDFLKDVGKEKTTVKDYTLGQWLDRWLQSYRGKRIPEGEKQIQQSTLDEYKKYARLIKKYKISKAKLVDIKSIMIGDFFHDNIEKYSKSVIKKYRFVLNAAFEAAIENDLCYKNPMRNAAIPRKSAGVKKAFADDDVKTMTDFAINDDKFGVPMLLLLYTGMRSGELRAIGPNDINGRYVTIDKAIKETGLKGVTKSGKSRVVPLKAEIADIINKKLKGSTDKFVVGGERYVGKDTLRSKYNSFFYRMNKQLEAEKKKPVTRLPPHSCRHTYSTYLQRHGIKIEVVSAILGHSATAVTETYTHLDTLPDMISAVDSVFKPENGVTAV